MSRAYGEALAIVEREGSVTGILQLAFDGLSGIRRSSSLVHKAAPARNALSAIRNRDSSFQIRPTAGASGCDYVLGDLFG